MFSVPLKGDEIAGIKGKLVKKFHMNLMQASRHIENHFLVRFIEVPPKKLVQLEHFAIAVLDPKYND